MKKTLNVIKIIITWLLVIMAVAMLVLTVFSVSVLGKNNRYFLGYKAFIVRSDSMKTVNGDEEKGYFESGDLIFVKYVNPAMLEDGDIISYVSTNAYNYGEIVTHKIKSRTVNEKGEVGFKTYGTSTGAIDDEVVTYAYVLGKYESHIDGAGNFFAFFKTPMGYLLCVFIPLMVLLVLFIIDGIFAYKQHKKVQVYEMRAEMEKERSILIEENKKQKELIEKLMKMNETSNAVDINQNTTVEDETKGI